jgi:DHA1 family bicyclomycin/chloramphenicol resistance-like MFS transporter
MNPELAKQRKFIFVLGCLTTLAAMTIDMSLPAIPAMVQQLATDIATGQQIVGAFIVGVAIGQIPVGLMSDRFGRRPVLIVGVVLFTLTSVICTFAQSIELMLAARFVQGMSSAVGAVVTRAIVRDIASGTEAARLMSLLVMIFTAAPMLAPLLGAFLVTLWGWRAPFAAIAFTGLIMAVSAALVVRETHTPNTDHNILRQFGLSLREFFSHRQSIFGALLVMLPPAGFLSMITAAPALIVEIYDFPVDNFGYIFALTGVSILLGSMLNKRLLRHYSSMQLIGFAATMIALAGCQLLLIAWLEVVPFWWIWGNFCLYMFGTGIILPNSTALALDPVPRIAGAGASIVGVLQTASAALGSVASSLIFDGSVARIVIILGIFGVATGLAFLLRSNILGGKPIYVESD